MTLYEFLIKDKAGNILALLDKATSRSFEKYLNKSGAASFSLSPADPKATEDTLRLADKELYIVRDGVTMWGGELASRKIDLSSTDETLQLNAKGFFELLAKKIVGTVPGTPRVFTATDAGQIAWTLINEAQTGTNASFGITQGSIPATKSRDRTFEGVSVKEAIEGLSNQNIADGFDYEIDANKQFNVYDYKGRDLADVVFEWGLNILSISEAVDANSIANQVLVYGAGSGSEMAMVTRNSAGSEQATYKIRQRQVSYKDVSETVTLNDHGDKELAYTQTPSQIVSLKYKGSMGPALGSYDLGDRVRIKISYGLLNIDALYRIYGIKVKINESNDEDIELIFNPS